MTPVFRPVRRLCTVLTVALAILAVPFAAPIGVAQACGCGAFSPEHGGSASVPAETALVVAGADHTEDIYVSLTLDSDVRSGALLFPVPDPHAQVSAGPRTLFTDLDALTAPPLAPHEGIAAAGNGAGAPAVTEIRRQTIGPLDVVTLTATKADALSTWLTRHGFAAKPQLASAAAWFVARHWAFVAVRLRPSVPTQTLDGRLDPLRLHFRTASLVYPMRLSHLAPDDERVVVYTLAPHREDLRTADVGMRPVWAQRVRAGSLPPLARTVTSGTDFLTRFDGTLAPATVTDDFHFAPAASDATLRPSSEPADSATTHRDLDDGSPAVPIGAAAMIVGLGIGAAVFGHRRRAR